MIIDRCKFSQIVCRFSLSFASSLIPIFLLACASSDESQDLQGKRNSQQQAEYIYRKHDEFLFTIPPPKVLSSPIYPWDKRNGGLPLKINKEFFRCKGNTLNPCHVTNLDGEQVRYYDCGGIQKHGLPLKNGKEFIYPILIDLINDIQTRAHARVVITSGHRCPEHNSYIDPSKENQTSKHMIGAEVSFYVHGMEHKPELVIQYIQEFYQRNSAYAGNRQYQEFHRYEKKTDVETPPWFNKEIFIKLFKKYEGRNFDNRHPFPYISIQVRYDKDANENINYSWEKANKNYHRS